jgi:putative Mg2+ transporter-C (MgtC) family protein
MVANHAHLVGVLMAGAVIGIERSFHGRLGGFRTHSLVCLASSLLMLVMLYQWKWLPGVALDTVNTDPTRIAQGIMTGIGVLGAGHLQRRIHRMWVNHGCINLDHCRN